METCKLCFRKYRPKSLYTYTHKALICEKCMKRFKPKFIRFKTDGIKGLSIFNYDEFMRDLIYKFKGCFDYELGKVFIDMYKNELSFEYMGYTMIPAPSYQEDNETRGFNHVVEIFKPLRLKMVEAFEKTYKFKQAEHNSKSRKNISKYIKLNENVSLPKRVLLVDDIYTTGATMQTMISLLKSTGIKDIKMLVLCKTTLEEN